MVDTKSQWSFAQAASRDSIARRRITIALAVVLVILLYFNPFNYTAREVARLRAGFRTVPTEEEILSAPAANDAEEQAALLDRKFLSRLVSDSKHSSLASQALFGEKATASNYSAVIVAGRLSKDEAKAKWMFDSLYNMQEPQLYVVDDNTTSLPHLDVNHGREAAVYMKYIVENYDNLPDISFFWHLDQIVWHNNLLLGWNSVETINRMDRENIMKQGYVPSRCDHWPGCPSWITFNPSKAEHRIDPHRLTDLFTTSVFAELFPEEDEFPLYFAGTCCSQFAVSRQQIHYRPRETYERLLKWAVEYPDDAESGRIFEYSWPYIFTGRGVLCPAMQDCYCKTYNFCIEKQEDISAIERWNAFRTRREEVSWQVKFFEDAMETEVEERIASGESEDEVARVRESFLPEVTALRERMDHLVKTTWEAREAIIRYWKLPSPPVGW